ncbi:MAG TPA: S8 family peptidase [Anaerovoracaceae bacterium]|nr:S8 family peptidase [Anaerovoracaceae bacterium]
MIFQEINWIRSNIDKLSPDLRSLALEWYRPFQYLPCFLQKALKSIRQNIRRISVIVQMQPEQDYAAYTSNVRKATGCKKKKDLTLINSFTAKVNAKTMEKLVSDSSIKKVWLDGPIKAVLDVASPAVGAPDVWERSVTGKGIGVAVLDTGIYLHPDLDRRITAFKDFVGNKKESYDDNGHGTHCAGDIASNGSKSDSLYRGTAPGCNLIGVKVLDGAGSGSLSTVIQGIQWCIENKDHYGIRVISMSLGSTATQTYKEDPVCLAVEKAWNNGIVVCVAAGNEGPESRTIASPGIDPEVITVGASNDKNSAKTNDDTIADFSSRGPTIDNLSKPDVLCPGTNIVSLRSPNSTLDLSNKNARVGNDYMSLSGTSMATPVCAGIVALMLEADVKLKPDEVKKILMDTAKPLPGLSEYVQGSGLVNAKASVIKVLAKDEKEEKKENEQEE